MRRKRALSLEMNEEIGAIFVPKTDGVVPPSNGSCANNKAITCLEAGELCNRCGWNPKVGAKRLEKIREGLRNGVRGG